MQSFQHLLSGINSPAYPSNASTYHGMVAEDMSLAFPDPTARHIDASSNDAVLSAAHYHQPYMDVQIEETPSIRTVHPLPVSVDSKRVMQDASISTDLENKNNSPQTNAPKKSLESITTQLKEKASTTGGKIFIGLAGLFVTGIIVKKVIGHNKYNA